MALQIKKHTGKESLSDTGFNFLIYGLPGSGKSTISSTFPKPILYVDTENGTKYIETEMDVVLIKEWSDVKEILELIQTGEYKTVVWDVVDEVYELYLQFLKKEQPGLFNRAGSPTMSGWGVLKGGWRKFCKMVCKDANINAIFVCHEKTKQDDDGNIVEVSPKLMGSLASELVGFVDFVGYKETKYQIDFRDNPIYKSCKDRHGALTTLDSAIYNPTYTMLKGLVDGTYSELAATMPAVFKSPDEAFDWAAKLGISKEKATEMLESIKLPKKALEFRRQLHEIALKKAK